MIKGIYENFHSTVQLKMVKLKLLVTLISSDEATSWPADTVTVFTVMIYLLQINNRNKVTKHTHTDT